MSLDLDALGSVLVLLWLAVASTAKLTSRRVALGGGLLLGGLAAFAPIDGLPLYGYLRGHLGALSTASQLGLALGIARRLGATELPSGTDRRVLLRAALAAGLVLYPLSLGLSPYDPYRWGYGSIALVALAGALALVAWLRHWPVCGAALVLALLGYGLAAGESANLWDYLLDPWLVGFAAMSGVASLTKPDTRSKVR